MSWGEGVREAFEPATRRLALTGTPFRSDVNPIPFVTYAPGRRRHPALGRRLHLRLRPRAGRPRRPPGAVHGLLRRDEVAHPRRRRDPRPAGRAAHQGHARAGAAHGPRPAGVVDAGGARGRRQAALGSTPPHARRRWAGDRLRPGLRPRLRRAAPQDHRRGAGRGALRREGRVEEDRPVRRLRRAVDGRGPDGLRGRRRAPPGRRGLRHHHRHPAVLRAGRRPLRAGPEARRDRVGVPAVGAAPARLRLRDGGRARPRARPQGHRRGRHLRRGERPAGPGQRRGERLRASSSCPSRRSAPTAVLRPGALRRRRVRPLRRGARRLGGGDGLPRHPRPARARPGARAAALTARASAPSGRRPPPRRASPTRSPR